MSVPSENVTDTGNGFLTGVDPPQQPVNWEADTAVGQSQQAPPVQLQEPQAQNGSNIQLGQHANPDARFTAEDIERVRREEKEKLYGKISNMEEQMKTLATEREERLRLEQEAVATAEAERKAKEESEMELRELLQRKETEWTSQIDDLKNTFERDRALFEREKQLMELEDFKRAIVVQESEFIMPELRDLVHGNTEEEILASVEEMKERTAVIMQNMNVAATQQRQSMRGVAPTGAAPVGPMENQENYTSLTPDDIRGMDMETYRQYRDRLIPAASQQYRRGG